MSIEDYFTWKNQKKANENLSLICLKDKHNNIGKEIIKMLEESK